MKINRGLWLGLFTLGLVPWSFSAAAAPWENLLTLNRVEADPNKPYKLSESNGPWMIMACSFSGEEAARQARELVQELRERYKLPAYVYEKTFDLGDGQIGRGIDQYGSPLKMRYQRGEKIDEYAVLVGDYPAIDDPQAQETLKKLKYYCPDCLRLDKDKRTARNLAGWRLLTSLKKDAEGKKKGPMGSAFLTTNPMVPKEYFVPQGIDKFVQAMNEGVEYSLLDCPGKYTVQVAHFTGNVVLDQAEIRQVENGKKMKSRLVKAGEDAEKLTKALRIKGYEAYVFHDRYASIVTVGSFDSVGTPRADGKIEINPKIYEIIETFRAEQKVPPAASLPADFGGQSQNTRILSAQPKTLVGIPFDIQPIPVQVPKRSLAADYSG